MIKIAFDDLQTHGNEARVLDNMCKIDRRRSISLYGCDSKGKERNMIVIVGKREGE